MSLRMTTPPHHSPSVQVLYVFALVLYKVFLIESCGHINFGGAHWIGNHDVLVTFFKIQSGRRADRPPPPTIRIFPKCI